MSLIKCPDCGKEISSHAETCPHCGYPLKKKDPVNPIYEEEFESRTRGCFIGSAIAAILGVLYIIGGFIFNANLGTKYPGAIWAFIIIGFFFIGLGVAIFFIGRWRYRLTHE